MSREQQVIRVDPAAAIPGGEVAIECAGYDTSNSRACRATVRRRAGASGRGWGRAACWRLCRRRLRAAKTRGRPRKRATGSGATPARLVVGRKLAEDLHIVANPAFDPDDGSLYVTRSGSRGQRMPVSIFRIDTGGELTSVSRRDRQPDRHRLRPRRGRCSSRAAWTGRSIA